MLFKNNMRPAFATAGAGVKTGSGLSKIKDFFTKSEQSADDDFNSFGASEKQQRSAPRQERPQQATRRPQQKRRRSSAPLQLRPILTIAAAALAVVLLVAIIIVIICAAPAKNIESEDNVFAVYKDSTNNYRIVSNGEVLDESFKADSVKLIPAENNAFAYVEVTTSTGDNPGIQLYILEDDELDKVPMVADKVYAYASYEPGIVFSDKDFYIHYTPGEDSLIVGVSYGVNPESICISGDGSVVTYSTIDPDGIHSSLNYFTNGVSEMVDLGADFIPAKISYDGSYIYGVKYTGYDVEESAFANQTLIYLYTEDEGESFTGAGIASLNSLGTLMPIDSKSQLDTKMVGKSLMYTNLEGDELIFVAQKAALDSDGLEDESGASAITSYLYQVGSKKYEKLGDGVFKPTFADKSVVCPETYIDSFFEATKTVILTDEDGDTKATTVNSTYFVRKGTGTELVAEAFGKFSPDGESFYYIDEASARLMTTPLDSDDFDKEAELVASHVHSFAIIENGDLYIIRKGADSQGYISYYDSSTGKATTVDSKVNLDSISQCADSVFYSKNDSKGNKVTYIATEGASPEIVDFDSVVPANAPVVVMGTGNKGYIYVNDKSNNSYLFYTSNGADFTDVADGKCTIPGFSSTPAPAPQQPAN